MSQWGGHSLRCGAIAPGARSALVAWSMPPVPGCQTSVRLRGGQVAGSCSKGAAGAPRRLPEAGKSIAPRSVLLEQDDEWTVAERRYFSVESMGRLTAPSLSTTTQEILAAIA